MEGVKILKSLSYKVSSIVLPKFANFGSFIVFLDTSSIQSQKTQGFCVADFVTLPDQRLGSKIFLLFSKDKRTLRSKI